MGAWGEKAFDNDDACDWVHELQKTDDLSAIESAFAEVESVGSDYLDQGIASVAIAACEAVARLQSNQGYQDSSTEGLDKWVANHPIKPSEGLVQRARQVLDRILGDHSELKESWIEVGAEAWLQSIDDLRKRL